IVEHPFFINFVRELNGGYNLPTREILAGQMLERELAQVNSKIDAELNKEENLTLGLFNCMCYCYLFYINSSCFYLSHLAFDGWMSHTHLSIWNFVITTPLRKEYLYQLSDLSEFLHTAEYLSNVIDK